MLRSHGNFEVQELNSFQTNESLNCEQKPLQQQQPVKLFKCPFENCNKILRSKKSLNDHCRIHTGQKPYICTWPGCNKRFIQFSSFQKHQRIHQNEKPYKCPFEGCGKCFSQVSNLRRHLRIHTNEKPFYCEICNKFFNTSSNLKQHQEIHKEKQERKKFVCHLCGKEYFYQSNLNKHLRLKRCLNLNKAEDFALENSCKLLLEDETNSSVEALFVKQCQDSNSKTDKLTENLEFIPLTDQLESDQNSNIDQFLSFTDCKLFFNEQEINYDQMEGFYEGNSKEGSQLNQ